MEVLSLDLPGVQLLISSHIGDKRGYFAETFRADLFAQHVGDFVFVQDNESRSVCQDTIRSLHFQSEPHAPGKLVRCAAGHCSMSPWISTKGRLPMASGWQRR